MKFSIVASVLLNAYTALAADFCGQGDSVTTSNSYIIYNNLWGMNTATNGSQCTGLVSVSGTTVAWHTGWSWAGGQKNVKSFSNANLVFTPKKIANIRSIKTSMEYSYTGLDGAVANLAYDIFTASTAGNSISDYEIMVWLEAYGGAGPISSTGNPIATPTIGGYQWRLYDGYNGAMHVYSFVAVNSPPTCSTSDHKCFTGDLELLLAYLTNSYGLPTSQYVNTLQGGTEPFVGSNAKLSVSAFSIVLS